MTREAESPRPQDEVRAAGERLRDQAERAGESLAGRAESEVEHQKDQTAARIETVADAAAQSAERLRGEEDWLADGIGSAAISLEKIAHGLRDKRATDLLADVEAIGRERPAVLFGAAVALGFGAARLARSSRERRMREDADHHQAPGAREPGSPPAYAGGVVADPSQVARPVADPRVVPTAPGAPDTTSY